MGRGDRGERLALGVLWARMRSIRGTSARPAVRTITTWVGQPRKAGYSGDVGAATQAQLFHPSGIAFDASDNAYIADSNNSAIRRVDRAGIITTVAGGNGEGYSGDTGPALAARLHSPTDVALDGTGNLYVADRDIMRYVELTLRERSRR